MKRWPERVLRTAPNARPSRGYVDACACCALRVVHATKTGKPLHKHARSRLCRELGQQLRLAGEIASAAP